ncbi:serpin family protein [Bradymonas sediminis]|uniref:Serpin family protein n=1 Tax=Bradymonas sediminis TaxID=1548548 RepID=A0A2Z4FN16_9DELT|nr:serpin family protein [Bradymonas sediminis]AWV90225.1 serpin family protein [Bradymonas sediminis]TDP75807.1 serpin B [Bradymonas sediminis]
MQKYSLRARLSAPLLSLLLAGGLGAGAAGCQDAAQADTQPDPSEGAPGEVRSDKQRVANPQVSESARQALVAGNTDFALDLYREIAGEDKNLFYSPFSISEALAMTYAGARGETAAQMAETLHLNTQQDQVHPAFNWLDAHLMNLGETPFNEGSEPFELAVANSIWGQTGYHFEEAFLDTLALNYGAGLHTLDFNGAHEASRQTINGWVEDQTNDRIKDLIPAGVITKDTRLVLTNAIFFKASWLHAFEKNDTAAGEFTRVDNSTLQVDLMEQTNFLKYAQMEGYQAVELPYDGGDVSMLILLPEDLAAFEQNLDAATLSATVDALSVQNTTVTLPKFEFKLDLPLGETLQDMGMTEAFSDDADLSGMTGTRELMVSDVVHQAFVAVDEEGTEAAAATAVVVGPGSEPPEPVEFRADKPFIFMIRANQTGSLLFVGRVLEPNAAQ